MSSDGAMDRPRSARPARGDDRGLASIALGVLLVLALVATVVMVFSDNPVWMRIGTLSALWAAFIGAFLVARYRRQAAAEAARVRDLHTVYELQLEREISARREHEMVVEKDLRDSVRAETSDSILALRREIAALREQLGALGASLPEDRFAVSGLGPAGELDAAPSRQSVPSERVQPRRAAEWTAPSASAAPAESAAPAPPAPEPEPRATGVRPDATPSTERTEKFSPVAEPRRPAVRPVRRTGDAPSPSVSATPETTTSSPEPAPEPAAAQAAPTRAPRSGTTQEATEEAPLPSRHGDGTGLSVAELMARLGDDAGKSGGRRRRRSAD